VEWSLGPGLNGEYDIQIVETLRQSRGELNAPGNDSQRGD
jgi:hypothetical protein